MHLSHQNRIRKSVQCIPIGNVLSSSKLKHGKVLVVRRFRFDQLSFLKRIVHSAHSQKKAEKRCYDELFLFLVYSILFLVYSDRPLPGSTRIILCIKKIILGAAKSFFVW